MLTVVRYDSYFLNQLSHTAKDYAVVLRSWVQFQLTPYENLDR